MSVDPTLQYCSCGYRFHLGLLFKVKCLLFGDCVFVCPCCGSRMTFRLINHCVKIGTVENKSLSDLWKRG